MTKLQTWFLGIAAVGIAIITLMSIFGGGSKFGTALTYTASNSHLEIYNFLSSVITDLTALRTPFAGILTTTGTYNPPTISSSTVATTTVTLTGALVGDKILATFATTTSAEDWQVDGKVIAADTVQVNVNSIRGSAAFNAGLNLATSTLYVVDIPAATFAAPAALTATATSTP